MQFCVYLELCQSIEVNCFEFFRAFFIILTFLWFKSELCSLKLLKIWLDFLFFPMELPPPSNSDTRNSRDVIRCDCNGDIFNVLVTVAQPAQQFSAAMQICKL